MKDDRLMRISLCRAASSSGKEVADFDHAVQDSSHQGKKHPITFKYHEVMNLKAGIWVQIAIEH